MAKTQGTAFRFQANTGTFGSPSYTNLDCEVTMTISVGRTVIDTSGKCITGNWSELLGSGIGTYTVSVSGHYAAADTGVDRLWTDAVTNDTMIKWQALTFGTKTYSGQGQYTSFEITSAYDGVVDFSAELQGNGAIAAA
jgi:predicted secreted protein